MRVGQILLLTGAFCSLALFASLEVFAPAEVWHLNGPVAYLGRGFIAMAVLGVFVMASARLVRGFDFS